MLPACHAGADADAPRVEIIAPCGQPVRTSSNATVGWIETDDRMTPFLMDVSRGGEFPLDRFVPSGTVIFPRDRRLGENERIRLVSLVSPRDRTSPRLLFMRDVISLDEKPKMPEEGRSRSCSTGMARPSPRPVQSLITLPLVRSLICEWAQVSVNASG
jgi:hypothetical protein